jgi:hypothetical protein
VNPFVRLLPKSIRKRTHIRTLASGPLVERSVGCLVTEGRQGSACSDLQSSQNDGLQSFLIPGTST